MIDAEGDGDDFGPGFVAFLDVIGGVLGGSENKVRFLDCWLEKEFMDHYAAGDVVLWEGDGR